MVDTWLIDYFDVIVRSKIGGKKTFCVRHLDVNVGLHPTLTVVMDEHN